MRFVGTRRAVSDCFPETKMGKQLFEGRTMENPFN